MKLTRDIQISLSQVLRSAIIQAYSDAQINSSTPSNASLYLDTLRASGSGWHVCLNVLISETPVADSSSAWQVDVVTFFGLSTIARFLQEKRVRALQDRTLIRDQVFVHATAAVPYPSYIVTKQALVLALCVKSDYPMGWRDPFGQLIKVSGAHPELFCRVLQALVDEVVDFSDQRSKEEVRERERLREFSEGP